MTKVSLIDGHMETCKGCFKLEGKPVFKYDDETGRYFCPMCGREKGEM